MIDARRMEVFGQVFDGGGIALTPPGAWIIDEGSLAEWRERGPVVIFGSGASKCRETLPWAEYIEVEPSARGMIPLATAALAAGQTEDTAYFEPFYLKDFVVTTAKKKLF
jgi:tRNA threonylcarbamoyladenosine biosynthesis protein TsaB